MSLAKDLGVKYVQSANGDYLIPDLTLGMENEDYQPRKYARMRKRHLQEHRKTEFEMLLLSGKLMTHLREIDETARERIELIMRQMLEKNPAPDKATDQMGWVRHMNMTKETAEEIILKELVYN